MSICLYELEQRLKDLEEEQNRQSWLLQEEMNRLELELVRNKVSKKQLNAQDRLSQEGGAVKKAKVPPAKLVPVKTANTPPAKRKEETLATAPSSFHTNRHTVEIAREYVIRLTLSTKLPLEWSGTGWTRCGQGRHYSSIEVAQKSMRQLAKHWPADCLKIIERQVSETPSS